MSQYDGHQAKRQRISDNGASSIGKDDYRGDREHKSRDGPGEPNKVLLFTIMNAVYPITTEVIHTISEPCGEVQRIVIFRKRGVQAMVEFNSIQSAQRAKASLNGADIYSGCCTLKIEWAKPTRLNVYKNDDETWDYTGALDVDSSSQPALLGDAPVGYSNQPMYSGRPVRPMMSSRGRPPMSRGRGMRPPRPGLMGSGHQHQMSGGDYGMEDYGAQEMGAGSGMYSQSPVIMVYGLNPDKMNCERLFNVLCLYGNVMKIKFLKSKPGTAMVQMGDPSAVERAISSLSGMKFFEDKMILGPSKQMYLTDTGAPVGELSDGTPSQVDYSNSRNNRFTTTEQAAKNRIQNPSKVLHYYNAPMDLDEEKIVEICREFHLTEPKKFTPFKSKSDRSSSGLMEFETKPEALEALTMVNHYKMDNPNGRFPYILKLCFSTSTTATRE